LDSGPLGDVFDSLGLSNINDKYDNKSMSLVIQDELIELIKYCTKSLYSEPN